MSAEFTRASKESMQKVSVNWAHSVNEGKLDGTSANWAHSTTKGFLQVYSINQDSIG